MSVDPFIQSPGNSQSINPYSYIMNNPLSGTDPTGYVGCAASSINKTCANLSTSEGGFKEQSAGMQATMMGESVVANAMSATYSNLNGAGSGSNRVQSQPVMDIGGQQEVASGGTNQSQNDTSVTPIASSLLGVAKAGSTVAAGEGAVATGFVEWLAAGIRHLTGGAVVAAALTIPGDTPIDEENQYLYVTYTRVNPKTGQVYAGRTGGYGTPEELVHRRSLGQPHLTVEGFRPPTVDQWSTVRGAIRGREQQLIDFYGGARSVGGTARNLINGVADFNPNRPYYMNAARAAFGDLPDNSPQRQRWEGF